MNNPDFESLSKNELEEIARQTHYSLRERLIVLVKNPPEAENLTMLQNEIAAKMRSLEECHAILYVKEKTAKSSAVSRDDLFGSPESLHEYRLWRVKKLIGGSEDIAQSDDATKLQAEEKEKWRNLFIKVNLYDKGTITNHWHITASESSDENARWIGFGDIHHDLTLAHVMASFRRGVTTNIFYGSQLKVGDEINNFNSINLFTQRPEGITNNGKPQVSISKTGMVMFDMKI